MQCNHCGSSIFATDQFCMECGQLISAPQGTSVAPPVGQPAAAALNAPARGQAANAAQPADTIACANCAARLPRGARFCGDCGTLVADASLAPPVRPARVATAALPEPIPPFHANAAPKPPSGPVQTVLPPFQPASWAAQAIPEPEIAARIVTPPANEPAVASYGQPALDWASPAAPAPWATPPEPVWQPGMPQGTSKATEFQAPGPFPQGPMFAAPAPVPFPQQQAAGSSSPSQAFVQAITAMPMAPGLPQVHPTRKRSRYPRGQVITMIVSAIVTVVAALGGTILLLLSK